jgi:hypothetical protein
VVQFDAQHQRFVVACVNASVLSLIEAGSHKITNIPLPVRMPRRLHFQSVVVDPKTGAIFLAAEKKLVIVEPQSRSSQAIDLPHDFASLAVDRQTGEIFVVNHLGRSICIWGAAHAKDSFELFEISPETGKVKTLFKQKFPYGEITFDQANSAFGERAQWADAIFRLTDLRQDAKGRLWMSDYLSGNVWILEE